MNFAKEFEEFCTKRGNTLRVDNRSRTYEDIQRALEGCADVEAIDKYVCNQTSRKETVRKIMVAFFKYLEQEKGEEILSVLFDTRFYDYPFERQLEIAKYLHEPRTLAEIEERFNISGETRKKDIQALEEGIEIFGSTITLEKTRKERKDYYRCTMHPVFLPLNLTEVYAMTRYLEEVLDKSDINSRVVLNIVERIKQQLSDYALRKLYDGRRPGVDNDYISDDEMARQRETICMYLIKSDQPCSINYESSNYRGRMEHRQGKYQMILEDGTRVDIDPNRAEFIIESLEYK